MWTIGKVINKLNDKSAFFTLSKRFLAFHLVLKTIIILKGRFHFHILQFFVLIFLWHCTALFLYHSKYKVVCHVW